MSVRSLPPSPQGAHSAHILKLILKPLSHSATGRAPLVPGAAWLLQQLLVSELGHPCTLPFLSRPHPPWAPGGFTPRVTGGARHCRRNSAGPAKALWLPAPPALLSVLYPQPSLLLASFKNTTKQFYSELQLQPGEGAQQPPRSQADEGEGPGPAQSVTTCL